MIAIPNSPAAHHTFNQFTLASGFKIEGIHNLLESMRSGGVMLQDTLPIAETVSANTVRNHLHQVAQRAEDELGEERTSFIERCPRDWAELPRPPAPITIGIDGGYVRQWEDKKAHFEVIVGESMPEEGVAYRFGFVQTYDEKPKRWVFEVLKRQGMQSNQSITFLSDGGEDVREVQQYLSPESEHYLDWFHHNANHGDEAHGDGPADRHKQGRCDNE